MNLQTTSNAIKYCSQEGPKTSNLRLSQLELSARTAGGTTEDRCFFLYLVLLSRTTVEWMMDRLGLRLCALLQQVPPK